MPWLEIASVSAGAVVGSLLRWSAGIWLNSRWIGFPLGTLFVNCVGGLVISAVLFWLERSPNAMAHVAARWRVRRWAFGLPRSRCHAESGRRSAALKTPALRPTSAPSGGPT